MIHSNFKWSTHQKIFVQKLNPATKWLWNFNYNSWRGKSNLENCGWSDVFKIQHTALIWPETNVLHKHSCSSFNDNLCYHAKPLPIFSEISDIRVNIKLPEATYIVVFAVYFKTSSDPCRCSVQSILLRN